MKRLATGCTALDGLIEGLPTGSRTLIRGPIGAGKTVFAMQFLWKGLLADEACALAVHDRPFGGARNYFRTFGWYIEAYEQAGKLVSIQGFPHPNDAMRDEQVIYFPVHDFDETRNIYKALTRSKVTRFVAGDRHGLELARVGEEALLGHEHWLANWILQNQVAYVDVLATSDHMNPEAERAVDLIEHCAQNVIAFRYNESQHRRELRIIKLEGSAHPLDWMPVKITPKGLDVEL